MDDTLTYLSGIQDLVDLHEFMQDDDFADAMDLALKVIAKPKMPIAAALEALMKMQGYAFKFRMMGQVYMTIKKGTGGSNENQKKNVYFSVSEQCHELAQTLKYLAREYHG
jgi:hypothetical protein